MKVNRALHKNEKEKELNNDEIDPKNSNHTLMTFDMKNVVTSYLQEYIPSSPASYS